MVTQCSNLKQKYESNGMFHHRGLLGIVMVIINKVGGVRSIIKVNQIICGENQGEPGYGEEIYGTLSLPTTTTTDMCNSEGHASTGLLCAGGRGSGQQAHTPPPVERRGIPAS